MASDVYAFAILAWEVRAELIASLDELLNEMGFVVRLSLGNLRSLMRASSRAFIQWSRDADRFGLTTLNSLLACGR